MGHAAALFALLLLLLARRLERGVPRCRGAARCRDGARRRGTAAAPGRPGGG